MSEPTQADLDYLVANPGVWKKFETTFGSLPDGFAPPTPSKSDIDYVNDNPAVRDKFIATFGDQWLTADGLPPPEKPQMTVDEPGYEVAAPEDMARRPQMPGILGNVASVVNTWDNVANAYSKGGLKGVKDYALLPENSVAFQELIKSADETDESWLRQYGDKLDNVNGLLFRSVSRMGEALFSLPELGLKYAGFEDAAKMPQAVREAYGQAEKDVVGTLTPEVRRGIEESFVERADDGSLKFGEGASDPYWWLANGIDMGVMMLPGIGAGAKAARVAYGARYTEALATAAAKKAPTAVAIRYAEKEAAKSAQKAAIIANTAGEALPAAGMAGVQIQEKINSLDEDTMMGYDPYRQLREQGLSHEAARAKVSDDQAFKGAIAVAIATGVTGYPVSKLLGRWASTGGIAATRVGAVAKGVAVEGGQEFVQEGSQQFVENIAEKPITHIDAWEGVLESAITGAVLGGALGGAVGGVAGPESEGKKSPSRNFALERGLKSYNAARDNLYNALGTARDPSAKITKADVDAARQEYRDATVAFGEQLLAAGTLKPEEQANVAKSIAEAKAGGIAGAEDANVKGVVREADAAGAAQGGGGAEAGQATGQAAGAAKPGAEAQGLNEVETKRLDALNRVSAADQIEAADFQSLAEAGLAKVLPSGVAMLLPAGKRMREQLVKRMAAAEASASPEASAEPTAKPAKSVKSVKAEPAKPAAKPSLAPGYSEDEIGEGKPLPYVASEGETEVLGETDYAALDRLEAGKTVAPAEMENLVKTGLVASRNKGTEFVLRPAGRRELKTYRATRQTALERDLQKDVGVTGDTLRLSAEARRTGRKARAEAVRAQEQVDSIFAAQKAELDAKAAAEMDAAHAQSEADLAAQKEQDWENAKDEVTDTEYESLTMAFDPEQRSSLKGSVKKALRDVDAILERREAAARVRLRAALKTSGKVFDLGGAMVEGGKIWKDAAAVGALRLVRGVVRFADWAASMQTDFKGVTPHLTKLYEEAKKLARNPSELVHRKWKGGAKAGQLKGGPPAKWKTVQQQVEALRKEGEPYRYWYEESGKAILKAAGGDVEKARRLAGLLAIYSSSTGVGPNTGNAMKAWYQHLDGGRVTGAGRFTSQDRDAQLWLDSGIFPVGTKRSNFYVNLMREINPTEFEGFQGATVDLWMMRAFGYFQGAPTDAQYALVAVEIQKMAKATGWEPQQVQAAIWVAAKARYEETEALAKQKAEKKGYIKYKRARHKGKMVEAMEVVDNNAYLKLRRDIALKSVLSAERAKEAGRDYNSELHERLGQINWEARPSPESGLLPGIHTETNAARIAEHQAAIARVLQDDTGSDAIARRLGILSMGQIDGPSAWFYRKDDYFRFKHYSKTAKDAFVTLDIDRFGTGLRMTPQEESRGPRISLYPEDIESPEAGLEGATEYVVEVYKGDLYDMSADPDGFRAGVSFGEAEDAVKAAGWRGYYVSTAEGILRGQARLFYSHPAVRSDQTKSFRGYAGSGTALRVGVPLRHKGSTAEAYESDPAAKKKLSAYSAILGALLKQNATSWLRPYYGRTVAASNGMDVDIGRPLTAEESLALYRETARAVTQRGVTDEDTIHAFAPVQHASGAYFLNFTDSVSNADFHQIVVDAARIVFGTDDMFGSAVAEVNLSRFNSDGGLISNDWKVNPNGEDYRRGAENAGEREAFDWAIATLAPKIEAVNRDFAQRYGWDRAAQTGEVGGSRGLTGAPADAAITVSGPYIPARFAAQAYMREAGLAYDPPTDYVKVDPSEGKRIATAYARMRHRPDAADVKASYAAMIAETLAQYQWIKKTGLKIDFIAPGEPDPYGGNPRGAIQDVRENGHLWVFPTSDGFGTLEAADANHPMLAMTDEVVGTHKLVANDVFRVVHDYFGHIKEGVGFRANGEENAWRQHAAMYSPLARRAMTAETRGQNSWVNWGPFGDKNRSANGQDTIYAPQKAGLLPEEFSETAAIRAALPMRPPRSATAPVARMQADTARRAVAEIERAFGVPVHVAGRFRDLPDSIRAWATSRGTEDIAGVYDERTGGAIHIVAAQHSTPNDVVETYAHEVVGHLGMRAVLGRRFKPVMAQILASFPSQVAAAARRSGLPLVVSEKVSKAQVAENKMEAAEELVAYAAGATFRGNGKLPKRDVYRRVVDMVRSALLRVGVLKTWKESDIDALIARSADYVMSGRAKRQRARRKIQIAMGREPSVAEGQFSGEVSGTVLPSKAFGFAAWFGDSKVRHTDGTPITVYHGTKNNFETFEVGRQTRNYIGLGSYAVRRSGLFFAENKEFADVFAGDDGTVMPVYLSIQNPIYLDDGFRSIEGKAYWDLKKALENAGLNVNFILTRDPDDIWSLFDDEYNGPQIVDVLKSLGYDGVSMTEVRVGDEDAASESDDSLIQSVWVAFSPTQVKSIHNNGRYDPLDGNIMASNGQAPVYYSAVARAVDAVRMTKAKGAQWYATIKNSPGIKEEELDWLGLEEWLDPNTVFTKDDVLTYLHVNQLEINEDTRTGSAVNYAKWKLAGGSNYREVTFRIDAFGVDNAIDMAEPGTEDTVIAKFVNKKLAAKLRKLNAWKDPHFYAGGNIGHMRVTDRMSPDEKKTLHIEEFQADLHQQGRDVGYAGSDAPVYRVFMKVNQKRPEGWSNTDGDVEQVLHPVIGDGYGVDVTQQEFLSEDDAKREVARIEYNYRQTGGPDIPELHVIAGPSFMSRDSRPPDAPFKTVWPDVLLKRALRWAVDEGYERVTWSPGAVHAERYSLTKVVDELIYVMVSGPNENPDTNEYEVEGRKNGRLVIKQAYRQSDLAATFGRDVSAKIIAGENKAADVMATVWHTMDRRTDTVWSVDLSEAEANATAARENDFTPFDRGDAERLAADIAENGEIFYVKKAEIVKIPGAGIITEANLAIGGAGMLDFYDNMMPKIANKIVKKMGGRVERFDVEIDAGLKREFSVVKEVWGSMTEPQKVRWVVYYRDSGSSQSERIDDPAFDNEVDALRYASTQSELYNRIHKHAQSAWGIEITDGMQKSVGAGMPMFARNTGDPELDAFLSKIGGKNVSMRERISAFRKDLGDRMRQNWLDHFHGIARTGAVEGYMSARLSTGVAGMMRGVMEWGHPVWDGDMHGIAGDYGFNAILKPLGADVNDWAAWMVARRANRLMAEGKERLFTQSEIDAALRMGDGRQDFAEAARLYSEFKKKVLDFAEAGGMVDPTTRPLWENDDHIPFYRIMEDGLLKGATAGRGLGFVKNQIVKLKGGDQNIGDPIENILRNWTALIEASMQAKAARTTIDYLTGTGLVVKIDDPSLTGAMNAQALNALLNQMQMNPGQMSPQGLRGLLALSQPAANKDGVITVWRDGKRERWQVHDPMLFKSLQAINPTAWSPWMNLLRAPKRVLTKTITVVPLFIARNFWRDIWSSFTIGTTDGRAVPYIPVVDNMRGVVEMLSRGETSKALIASGAGFVGTGYNPRDAAAEAVSLAKDVRLGHRFWHAPMLMYHAYMRMSEASENASRVAIYEAALKAGRSKMEAAYEAKDIMDFSLRGSGGAARFLVETVPFWGARTQGLYKLGRAAAENPKGVFLRGMLLTLATLAIFARAKDDERYKSLTADAKNTYWHAFDVFQPGDHWQIPKPFEVGTIFGTIPEAILDATIANSDQPDAAKQSLDVVAAAFMQTLNLSPEVAAIWPMVELAINKDTFTKAPILNQSDYGVLPQDQDSPQVRATYRMVARAMPEFAPEALKSPKQLQHLARGYIGSLQDWVLVATDYAARKASGEPPPPAGAATEPLFIGGFRKTGPLRSTKQLNEMYDVADAADKVFRSINKLSKSPGGGERIESILEKNSYLLGINKTMQSAVKDVTDMRKAQRAIQMDAVLSPEEKRKQIDAIQQGINDLAAGVYELRPGGPISPEGASKLLGANKNSQAAILRREGLPASSSLVDTMPTNPTASMSSAFKDLEE